MRRKGLWIAMVAMVGMSAYTYADTAGMDNDPLGYVTGIDISDGSLSDWGVTLPGSADDHTGSVWTPSGINAQGAWVFEDSVGGSNYVGPLYGGQDFDAEALYTGYNATTNTLYVALVTGFNLGGENGGGATGSPFSAGDIFIDFGVNMPQNGRTNAGQGDNVSAPANSLAYINAGHAWDLAFLVDQTATLTNNTTGVINASAVHSFGIDQSPTPSNAGADSGPLYALSGQNAGSALFQYTQGINGGNRNLYEFSYVLGNNALHNSWRNQLVAGWTAHWTMSCGNDFLDTGAYLTSVPPNTNIVPVPAAAPLGLLGMGLLALVRRVRRRPEC